MALRLLFDTNAKSKFILKKKKNNDLSNVARRWNDFEKFLNATEL